MSTKIELVGHEFGFLLVVEELDKTESGRRQFRCRCKEGNELTVRYDTLLHGNKVTCGDHSPEEIQAAKVARDEMVAQLKGAGTRIDNESGVSGITLAYTKDHQPRWRAEIQRHGVKYRGVYHETLREAKADKQDFLDQAEE
jgi:hypothetical protein